MDAATEAYVDRIVDAAPPLTPEQAAIVVRLYGPAARTPASGTNDAA